MKHIDVAGISSDPEKRMAFLEEFIGFTTDDWAALGDSVAILGPRLPGLLDALYEHLLSFDDTRRIFLGQRGEVDPNYMAVRKEHLTQWVLHTVGAAANDKAAFARYLSQTGRRHTGVEGEAQRVVPPRYMVALISFIQSAIFQTLSAALPGEQDKVVRLGLAWNKMLVIQLEMFLKVLGPHFPQWD
jgi:hypothetical protein